MRQVKMGVRGELHGDWCHDQTWKKAGESRRGKTTSVVADMLWERNAI